ncbi:hypothetical protein SporoP32a_13495 [Sporosarcina ureae]|nr:hypothetical protein SporoP32a_13495 [Sporosarcina ureae]
MAADCPIPLFFNRSRLPFPAALSESGLQEVPAIHPVMRPIRYRIGVPEPFTEGVVARLGAFGSIEIALLVLLELRCCSS